MVVVKMEVLLKKTDWLEWRNAVDDSLQTGLLVPLKTENRQQLTVLKRDRSIDQVTGRKVRVSRSQVEPSLAHCEPLVWLTAGGLFLFWPHQKVPLVQRLLHTAHLYDKHKNIYMCVSALFCRQLSLTLQLNYGQLPVPPIYTHDSGSCFKLGWSSTDTLTDNHDD